MATKGQELRSGSGASDMAGNKKFTSSFAQFDITATDVLNTVQKMHCPTCNRNVRYYCAKCLKPVNCPDGSVPQLKLPIKIDVIKHEQERDGKSTALHAKILAPDDVEVYGWKDMPEYKNVDRLLLLFPSPVSFTTTAPRVYSGICGEGMLLNRTVILLLLGCKTTIRN